MSELKFTEDHEWIRTEEDGHLTIGITPYAQENLGDIVYVELPEPGTHITAGDAAVVIESVKAAADIKMPIAGEVIEINEALADAPETVNEDPLGAGWFFRIRADSLEGLSDLLNSDAYDALVGD